MKPFKPTYLYVKTHNITGLKYFGKTTSNRNRYRGSGPRWVAHIKKHGYDVTTEIVGFFTDREKCRAFAIEFSEKNNIVNSKEWANQQIENGLDGGDTVTFKTPDEIDAIKKKRKQTFASKSAEDIEKIRTKNSEGVKKYIKENVDARKKSVEKILVSRKSNGKPWHSEETRKNISKNNKAGTAEVRKKISESLSGRKNPIHSKYMTGRFVGKNHYKTRIFIVIDKNGDELEFIGCEKLNNFCRENNVSYTRILQHINQGIITQTSNKGPSTVKNLIGYEIKEIKNDD